MLCELYVNKVVKLVLKKTLKYPKLLKKIGEKLTDFEINNTC